MPSVTNPLLCINSATLWWCAVYIIAQNAVIWDDPVVLWDSMDANFDGDIIQIC